MAQPAEGARLPRRVVARRSRKRWTVVFCIAASWVVLYGVTGSMLGATVLLLLIAAFGGACLVALRTLGVNASHPWVQQLASRPWRDGQDVLRLSLRRLPDVFVITPRGSLLAPNAIELRMNPRDFASLTDVMDVGLVNSSTAEVYAEEVAAHGAHFANPGPVEVSVVGDAAVPEGRYRLQQSRAQQRWAEPGLPPDPLPGQPSEIRLSEIQAGRLRPGQLPPGLASRGAPQPGQPWPDLMQQATPAGDRGEQGSPENGPHLVRHTPGDPWPFAHDGRTAAARAAARTPAAAAVSPGAVTAPAPPTPPGAMAVPGLPTMAESSRPAIPPLRLVSGQSVAQTWTSGARAGRGAVELVLPDVPTVSREHARFTFADGRWWVANLGMNGLTLNGVPLAGEQPVSDGDTIRWGRSGNTLVSRVEIG